MTPLPSTTNIVQMQTIATTVPSTIEPLIDMKATDETTKSTKIELTTSTNSNTNMTTTKISNVTTAKVLYAQNEKKTK